MFGIIFGSVCLVGLTWVLARRPHWRPWQRMAPLYRVFQELETSAGQEKAIRQAVHEVFEDAKRYREQWQLSRKDIAHALKQESFDQQALDMALSRHDDDLVKARRQSVDLLSRLHAVLDTRQRDKLARFVESGGPHFGLGRAHHYGC